MRRSAALFAASFLAVAGIAVVGGVLFAVARGGTSATRAIAYALWFAAALCLLGKTVSGTKRFWRRTSLPVVEGWVFVAAATLLTALGAAIDALGS